MLSNFGRRLSLNLGIIAGVLLLIIGLTIAIGFDVSANGQFIADTRSEISSRSRAINELSRLRKAAEAAEPYIAWVNERIPTKDALVATFPAYVKQVADKNNLVLLFRFGDESKVENLSSIRFDISIQGDYAGVRSFTPEIENAPYFLRFNSMSMVRQVDKHSSTFTGAIIFKPNEL